MLRLPLVLGALSLVVLSTSVGRADVERPRGIYLLSDPLAPSASILGQSFVDGFAQRLSWQKLEPAPGLYNFSRLDTVVAAMRPLGKPFTLSILSLQVPTDLVTAAGPETVSVQFSQGTVLTVLPWHRAAQERWEALLDSLANYRLPDDAAGGGPVPLRDHSLLYGISCTPFGMNGIRDLGGKLLSHPLYDRDSLIAGVLRSQVAMRDALPSPFGWLAFFRMSDRTPVPPLDVELLDSLRARFWNGNGPPRLGLFAENLACSTPTAAFAWALAQEQDATYITFQALQGWLSPFANPAATDACLVSATPGNRSTAVSGPEVGMQYAYDTFHGRYFEMYKSDLGHPGFADEFAAFHAQLWNEVVTVTPDASAERLRFVVSPNPARGGITVEALLPTQAHCRVEVLDIAGRRLRRLADAVMASGRHRWAWDGRDERGFEAPRGIYLVRLESGSERQARVLIRR